PTHSYGLIDAPKTLADIVESTIGAIYVNNNSSIDATWEVAKILLEPMITPDMLQQNLVLRGLNFRMCKPALATALFNTISFLLGGITSAFSVFLGMKIDTHANARTTLETRNNVG
nr:ribonuclease 3-like protein 3 [Tanacetum cinerariifolium]